MSLNKGEINPLNVLGFRKLTFLPKHFSEIKIDYKIDIKALEHWIEYNLNSRYAIVNSLGLDQSRKVITVTRIGVEDPKELTMLTLGCNFLYKNKGY